MISRKTFSATWGSGSLGSVLSEGVARRQPREPLLFFHLCSGCRDFQSESSTWWGILPTLVVLQTFKLALNQLLLESTFPVPCYLPICFRYTSPCCNKAPYNSGLKTEEFIFACGLRRQPVLRDSKSIKCLAPCHLQSGHTSTVRDERWCPA